MQKVLGIIIGVSAAILIFSISLLTLHNFIVEKRKKNKMHERIKQILKDNQKQQQQYEKYRSSSRRISIRPEEIET